MASAKSTRHMLTFLGDSSIPIEHRSQKLIDILAGAEKGEEICKVVSDEVFKRLAGSASDELCEKRAAVLGAILEQLNSAPMRPATFVKMTNLSGGPARHALILLDNGESAYVVAHDQNASSELPLGSRVMVDASSKLLVDAVLDEVRFGPEARFERKTDPNHIEVVTHQDERSVVMVGKELMKQIDSGQVAPGAAIVLGAGGRLGLCALPPEEDNQRHFRFLDKGSVPDVIVERDIGAPPRIIDQVERHVREEMTRPELRRKFRLRPCITRMLAGVSGSGKTLAVQAIHRKVYEVMSEVTGEPLHKLPPRVFRFRMSKLLSMWFGESDKNIDRVFDEVEMLAGEPYAIGKREFRLPVMVVIEEADGIGRARGGEAIYDRVMTTLLQRLDPNRQGLSDKLIVFLSTTNEPHMVDPAFLRRIGGSVETFGRLNREAFNDILGKHLKGLPVGNGGRKNKTQADIIAGISKWMFAPGIDPGVVELAYHGKSEAVVKYRRDFLTGALIDRAVQEASTAAWELSLETDEEQGVTFENLLGAMNRQVQSVVEQLCPQNVHSYVDLPDGVRVTGVRRITKNLQAA